MVHNLQTSTGLAFLPQCTSSNSSSSSSATRVGNVFHPQFDASPPPHVPSDRSIWRPDDFLWSRHGWPSVRYLVSSCPKLRGNECYMRLGTLAYFPNFCRFFQCTVHGSGAVSKILSRGASLWSHRGAGRLPCDFGPSSLRCHIIYLCALQMRRSWLSYVPELPIELWVLKKIGWNISALSYPGEVVYVYEFLVAYFMFPRSVQVYFCATATHFPIIPIAFIFRHTRARS